MNPERKRFACVPNVSEGRDAAILDACADAIAKAGARLAHRTSDGVHHRAVFTFFGDRDTVQAAAIALACVAAERIDLRTHRGAHPRIGALDVLPFVPYGAATLDDAAVLARETGERIWQACGVPSVFYGAAATTEARRNLPDVRAGEFEGLIARGHRGGPPDAGTIPAHPSAGAIAIGARLPLIAYNVILETGDLSVARDISRSVRERGGGLRTLRCLPIALDDGRSQVSCNLTDVAAVPLDLLFNLVRDLAGRHGVRVVSSELIGLIPRAALVQIAARVFRTDVEALTAAEDLLAASPEGTLPEAQ